MVVSALGKPAGKVTTPAAVGSVLSAQLAASDQSPLPEVLSQVSSPGRLLRTIVVMDAGAAKEKGGVAAERRLASVISGDGPGVGENAGVRLVKVPEKIPAELFHCGSFRKSIARLPGVPAPRPTLVTTLAGVLRS